MAENKKKESNYSRLKGFDRAVPIILWAVSLFVGLCFILEDMGSFGAVVSSALLGLFSYAAYSIPLLLALHAAFYPSDAVNRRRISRIVFSLVVLIIFASAIYTVGHLDGNVAFDGEAAYSDGQQLLGGGFVGNAVSFGVIKAIGVVGYFILAGAVIAVYLTYFIARINVSVAKAFYGTLSAIAGVFARAESKAKKSKEAKAAARAEKNRKRDDVRRRDLYRDEYFEVDNGMQELSIDELGINERRSRATVEMNPTLSDSVHHKSAADAEEIQSERGTNDGIFFSDGTVTIKTAEKAKSTEKKIDLDYGFDGFVGEQSIPARTETASYTPTAETKRSATGIDESADSVFTRDFDPFDFAAAERLASKPSSRSTEVVSAPRAEGGVFERSINNLTEEDIAKARRLAEFEDRKRKIIERENAYRRAQEARAQESATRTEPVAEAPVKEDPAYTPPVKEEPIFSAPAKQEPVYTPPVKEAPIFSAPAKQEPVYTPPVKEEPVFSAPAKQEPVYTPPVKEEPIFSAPAKQEPAFTPYAPTFEPEPIKIEPSSLKSEPAEERDFRESRSFAFESSLVEEMVEDISLGDVDPEEDVLPETPVERPEEDEVVEMFEPIPESEQNPAIRDQQRMFTIFDEPEKKVEESVSEPASEATVDDYMPDVSVSDYVEDEADDYVVSDVEDEPPFEIDDEPVSRKAEQIVIPDPITVSEPAPEPVRTKPDYSDYRLPPIDLLGVEDSGGDAETNSETADNANKLIETLASFNVTASIKGFDRGPRITRYEVVPAKGVRVSSIMNLFDDIALNLAAEGVRMEAPIPGKSAVGVEIPNKKPYTVRLRSLLETEEFTSAKSKTFVCVGKDVAGQPVFGDISKMPHVLIAGATGMGKSVCINSLLLSMLYKARPDEVKLIMIDPKKVEFNMYNGIPHLLVPVVTDPKQAAGALMWAVEQMEKRYDMIEQARVRNIEAYNAKVLENPGMGEPMPKIVIVVDELADLMLQVKNPVESLIMSIAQKARAAGIHLIIGTQRPSVDIITGVIKANIPTRISCKVMSNADSRTILDIAGAEKLLDKGDMLFNPAGAPKPKRVQGAFVSDSEVESIIEFIKAQASGNVYDDQALEEINRAAQKCSKEKSSGGKGGYDDDSSSGDGGGLYNNQEFLDAVEVAVNAGKISTSLLQRKLSIGFGKAAKYIDGMEELGIVAGPNGQKPRDVLISKDEWFEKLSRVSLD